MAAGGALGVAFVEVVRSEFVKGRPSRMMGHAISRMW
jgi:hypothetical protein